MHIPKSKIAPFVASINEQCLADQKTRIQRATAYMNYFNFGAENQENAAIFNKTFAYIDDLESLLYSPVSLKFHVGNPDLPNALEQAKGRAASTRMGTHIRTSDTDTRISQAVSSALVKGKSIVKSRWNKRGYGTRLIQPEMFGVLTPNHEELDEEMEAFTQTSYITPYQFQRIIWDHPDKAELMKKAKRYTKAGKNGLSDAENVSKAIAVGGIYPFRAGDSNSPNTSRGIVDWMSGPTPEFSPQLISSLLQYNETWIWDDEREDWATFQMIGDDMLIMGRYRILNALAYNPDSQEEAPDLKGKHPFTDFCPNRTTDYFWGRSEIVNVALLQECINSRFNGINKMLRKQEDPSTKFIGSQGVNQQTLNRYRKPGGYWTDTNPNAKVEDERMEIGDDLWVSLHEYERMFDEMGGLPPIAKGRGEAGVRSQGHAETLVRMFSPRFKDRALITERNVAALGGLMLDLARCFDAKKLTAWVQPQYAGLEADVEEDPFLIAPAPGMKPVTFAMADLDDDMAVTVNSHSSSPAFEAEAKGLAFDLLKIGAMDAEQVVDNVDAPDPQELIAGIERRGAEKSAAIAKLEPEQQLKILQGGGKKH